MHVKFPAAILRDMHALMVAGQAIRQVYILAKRKGRVLKERAMRRKKLKKFWARLKDLLRQAPSRDQLL